ncbi:MAG TPA: response regulator transcription factor [Burkholderiales bacterium]|nr:response regulator transcription factor [Burkholderiales bacterium]
MIKVVLADDHAVVRRGIRQILTDHQDIEVVGEAANAGELTQLLRQQPCDVLLLDISMPGKNGIDALKALKKEWPRLQVLMLSMYPEDQFALRALRAGASGYLTKHAPLENLPEAVRRLASGKKYITPEAAEFMADVLDDNRDVPPHELLSDREFQTLRLIASGKTLSGIADELCISPKTVSVYRARLLEKMKLKNNAELTHYALKNNLTE